MDKLSKHHPAAFINVIAEEGSKAEAIKFLQETWNDYCELKHENERLRETLTIIDMQALNVMQDDVPPYGAILKCGWVHEKCKAALSDKESSDVG